MLVEVSRCSYERSTIWVEVESKALKFESFVNVNDWATKTIEDLRLDD